MINILLRLLLKNMHVRSIIKILKLSSLLEGITWIVNKIYFFSKTLYRMNNFVHHSIRLKALTLENFNKKNKDRAIKRSNMLIGHYKGE
jgi:hypothetical protein